MMGTEDAQVVRERFADLWDGAARRVDLDAQVAEVLESAKLQAAELRSTPRPTLLEQFAGIVGIARDGLGPVGTDGSVDGTSGDGI